MPNFRKLSDAEVSHLTRRHTNLQDLTEYLEYLGSLKVGDWGAIDLSEDDSQRAIKRRTSLAASSQGKKVVWRRSLSATSLIFQIVAKPAGS